MYLKKSHQSNLRQGRYDESGLFYFITAIIKNREDLLSNPVSAQIVLDAIRWLDRQERIALVVSVVMPDHIHFVAQLKDTTLPKLMHSLKSYTANEINKVLGRNGQVWESGYYERGIRDEESLMELVRYCLENPVRKGLVGDFRNYPYWYCIFDLE